MNTNRPCSFSTWSAILPCHSRLRAIGALSPFFVHLFTVTLTHTIPLSLHTSDPDIHFYRLALHTAATRTIYLYSMYIGCYRFNILLIYFQSYMLLHLKICAHIYICYASVNHIISMPIFLYHFIIQVVQTYKHMMVRYSFGFLLVV
jgi:hypothetical protein